MAVTLSEARQMLQRPLLTNENIFDILRSIAHHGALTDRDQAREMLFRVLDRRNDIPPPMQAMLDALVREHGLFPYLRDVVDLPLADQLAVELHRPPTEFGVDVVFHSEQAFVYERLLAGENVVLSAPTSFGKSILIDALLAERGFRNAAVVVPTIALIDECRRRLTRRLSDKYKVITHASQPPGDRNLYVMTQERLLEMGRLPDLDFFAIDEFYKLDPAHGDPDRSDQLNIVFHRLLATGAQFYLLGPTIAGLSLQSTAGLRATFVTTDFTTVAVDVTRVTATPSELPGALVSSCRDVGPRTMIYCRSPQRTTEVAGWLMQHEIGGGRDLDGAAEWVGQAYHPEWIVARALRRGIGIHHGRLPRALAHHMLRLFDQGRLPYLLVTSTLIEGVNTAARNVLILDSAVGKKKYDYFTFCNIRGRSGRMTRHYVGRVVVFSPPPAATELTIDIPALSQSRQASPRVLLQVPEHELTDESRQRLAPYLDQNLVAVDTLRRNRGVDPDRQLRVAEAMATDPARWTRALSWRGPFPTREQVRELGELLFLLTGSGPAVLTAAQLGARINMLRHQRGDLRALIASQTANGEAVDKAVEDALDFARNWAQYKIPTAMAALQALAEDVLGRRGALVPDTRVFAGELENLFLAPFVTTLEEYGLPTSVSLKLAPSLGLANATSLDEALGRLRQLEPPSTLTPFEHEMLEDVRLGL